MGLGKLQQQHKRHQERLAEERRRAVEKIQRENEALRALARQIQDARKARDRQAAFRLGETLMTLARTRCKDFLDGDGDVDVRLLAGILVEAQARLVEEASLAGLWVASGERYLPRRTKGCNASDAAASSAESLLFGETDQEMPPETSDGLPSIDALFNGGELRS